MITRFEVEGYKSFGSPGVNLNLDQLNFLVGPNGSGKTNFLSSLEFLKNAVMQDVVFAVSEHEGLSEIRNRKLRQRTKEKPIRFLLTYKKNITINHKILSSIQYELILDPRKKESIPSIKKEELLTFSEKGEEVHRLTRTSDKVVIEEEGKETQTFKFPSQELHRLALGVGFFFIPSAIMRDIISKWRFFNISPSIARMPYRDSPNVTLGKYGENFSTIIHHLKQKKDALFLELEELAKEMVPGFKEITSTQIQGDGKWLFNIFEDKIRSPFSPTSASDGTVRLLILLVIVAWTARQSSLITIEEPENGLHPHLFEQIVHLIRESSQRWKTQFIITTHNPDFLDHLSPKEVLFSEKKEGFTKIHSANDIQQIEAFCKRFSLGELWEQGVLGGTP